MIIVLRRLKRIRAMDVGPATTHVHRPDFKPAGTDTAAIHMPRAAPHGPTLSDPYTTFLLVADAGVCDYAANQETERVIWDRFQSYDTE